MKEYKYIIYVLTEITGEYRYIGKSTYGLTRPNEHFKPFNLKAKSHKVNWIKKVLARGDRPSIHILEVHNNPEILIEREKANIAYYRSIGCDLTNETDGGEGALGHIHSPESKEKMRIARLGKPGYIVNRKSHTIIDGIEHRNCGNCKTDKPITEFSKSGKRWSSYCRLCLKLRKQEYDKKNPYKALNEQQWKDSYKNRQKKAA